MQYGFEIVCIAGHREILTPEDIKEYIREKKNVPEKDRCNTGKAGKY